MSIVALWATCFKIIFFLKRCLVICDNVCTIIIFKYIKSKCPYKILLNLSPHFRCIVICDNVCSIIIFKKKMFIYTKGDRNNCATYAQLTTYAHDNQLSVFENLCDSCNRFNCSCPAQSLSFQTEENHSESANIVSIPDTSCSITNLISSETSDQRVSIDNIQNFPQNSNTESKHLSNKNEDPFSICLMTKGYNICHLNMQGLCGDKLSKFSEISLMLTCKENEN